jgi:hypothetical protein
MGRRKAPFRIFGPYTCRVRAVATLGIAAVAFAGARVAQTASSGMLPAQVVEEPFAPAPDTAPYLSLGYREFAADLFWVRLTGYFGGDTNTAQGIGALVDAIVALDPKFHRIYDYGANAMTLARYGVDQSTFLHAIAVLEKGAKEFPDDYRLPLDAGQMYTLDLKTTDPAQRRAWDDKGTMLVEAAVRKPGAPAEAADFAAVMRTKMGEHDRAVRELREMLLITSDTKARARLADRLAKLENTNSDELAAEIYEQRHRFETTWKHDRPAIPSTMYILLGPHIPPRFDMTDLATGGHDLVGSEPIEGLEPLD